MRRVLLACLLPITATISSCLTPTEIQLHITTNACTALSRTDIYVGDATAPATSTGGCTDSAKGEIGTITVLPSGSLDAHIDIAVVASLGDACSSPSTTDTNCIISRRSLSFEPHAALPLPVFLDSACAGVSCPGGTCVADANGAHCQSQACDVDGGLVCVSDAGLPGEGGITDGIAFTDGPTPSCASIGDAGTPKRSWSFDPQGDGKIHEDHAAYAVPIVAGNVQTTAGVTFCGPYLSAPIQQPLSPSTDTVFGSNPLALAFAYRTTATDGTLLNLQTSGPVGGGFAIGMAGGLLDVHVHGSTVEILAYKDSATSNDGKWHKFQMVLAISTKSDSGTTATTGIFTRDGVTNVTSLSYTPTQGPLVVGGMAVGIDQLAFY